LPLESSQDLLGQRRVEVIRYGERPSGEAKRARTRLDGGDRAQLGHRPSAADHDETLSSLNPVQ
jgi:hypothetical protein